MPGNDIKLGIIIHTRGARRSVLIPSSSGHGFRLIRTGIEVSEGCRLTPSAIEAADGSCDSRMGLDPATASFRLRPARHAS